MKKKYVLLLVVTLVAVLALFAFTACNNNKTEIGKDLLASLNGGFESSDSDNTIADWHSSISSGSISLQAVKASDLKPEYSDFDFGTQYLALKSTGSTNYVYQTVSVDKKAVYKITVDMKISSSVSTDNGAYITFKENMDYKFIKATDSEKYGKWTKQTIYVRPTNINSLTICLALDTGSSSGEVTAYYDNVTITKVDGSGITSPIYDIKQTKDSATYSNTTTGIVFIVILSLASLVLLYAAYILIKRLYSKQTCFVDFDKTPSDKSGVSKFEKLKNPICIGALLMCGTFLVRLILLLTTYGMGSNMTALANLGYQVRHTADLTNAYGGIIPKSEVTGAVASSSLSNIAPGSLYILSILANIIDPTVNLFGTSVLIRLIEVLADVAIVGMIYFFGKKYVGNKLSTVYAGLYALLPVTFMLSGYVGTFECLVIALTVCAVLLMIEKKYIPMYIVITAAAIVNIEALAVAPIMLAYLVYQWYREDKNLKKITKTRILLPIGLVCSVILAYIVLLPISVNFIKAAPFGGFNVLINEISGNTIFVNNAFNLYSMVGMNMTTANSTASILNLVFILVLEIYVVSLYIHNKNKMEVLLLCSFIFAVIAVFTLKITFTYMILAIAFALIYTMVSGDRRMYFITSTYAILLFLNVAQLTNLSGLFVQNQTISGKVSEVASIAVSNYYELDAFLIIFSIFAVLITLYYFYVSYNITNSERIKDIKPMIETYPQYVKRSFKTIGTSIKNLFKGKNNSEE